MPEFGHVHRDHLRGILDAENCVRDGLAGARKVDAAGEQQQECDDSRQMGLGTP